MKLFMAIAGFGTIESFYERTGGVKLNYLISYVYLKGQAYNLTTKHRDMIDGLIMDSGAYSVKMGKAKVSLTEYTRYLKRYGDKFDAYFNLDDNFGSPEHNQLNQRFLEEHLVDGAKKPVPVVHDEKDPFGEFELYVQMGHDFIAFGSGNKRRLNKALEQVKEKYPEVRVHVFGDMSRKMLFKYRPYSADSKTWADVAGIGTILYWDEEENKEYNLWVGGRDREPPKDTIPFQDFEKRESAEEFLDSTFGFKYPDDMVPVHSTVNRQIVNLYFYTQLEAYINSLEENQ